ncbi:hypothetical protein [Polaromonas sp. JS666]|uniref:hypothetical protein n=1 Tax=Polaromonas sp. (strain JS666 / ATCC BAA-500) TaxID=296591 RepID=UPI00088774D6|nr:hypothetical protein [Polaromonas sp. JS666]SDN52245.1 hypothetical protein SAMN05720382_105328 [Polaromonas sp. JS666]
MDHNDISRPFLKASTAGAGAVAASTDVAGQVARAATTTASYDAWMFINSFPWDLIAKIAAAIYGVLVLSEWIWKKAIRPFCESRGWWKRRSRREAEESDKVPL